MLSSLRAQGWAFLDGVETTSDMMRLASELGCAIPSPTGELVKVLSPVASNRAPRHTLSAACGLTEFPFHTDTAFWPVPARYLIMRVVGDRRRETVLLSVESIWSVLGPAAQAAVQRSVWRTKRYAGGIYCSMMFSDGAARGWRFDSTIMVPANASACRARDDVTHAISESMEKLAVSWEKTSCIVVDNWQMLHARGAAPVNEGRRRLSRIYVR